MYAVIIYISVTRACPACIAGYSLRVVGGKGVNIYGYTAFSFTQHLKVVLSLELPRMNCERIYWNGWKKGGKLLSINLY